MEPLNPIEQITGMIEEQNRMATRNSLLGMGSGKILHTQGQI